MPPMQTLPSEVRSRKQAVSKASQMPFTAVTASASSHLVGLPVLSAPLTVEHASQLLATVPPERVTVYANTMGIVLVAAAQLTVSTNLGWLY